MTQASTKDHPRSGKTGKILALSAGVLILCLVLGYFVATSSAVLKSVLLPKAGAALGATVEAGEISLSPFSEVVIRGLKIKTTGTEPLLGADVIRARYDLFALLRGDIKISEAVIESPRIHAEQNLDGTSNWSPLLKALQGAPTTPSPSATASPAPKLNIGSVKLSKLDLTYIKRLTNGVQQVSINDLDLNISSIRNGQPVVVDLAAGLVASIPSAKSGAKPDSISASIKGSIAIALGEDLMPSGAKVDQLVLSIAESSGSFSEFQGLQGTLGVDWTPAEIKQLALKFNRKGQGLGEIDVAGPFKSLEQEGRLSVNVRGIGSEVINLALTGTGIDLGKLSLETTNVIELTKGAKAISIEGTLGGKQLSVSHAQMRTPSFDLLVKYHARIDQASKQAEVRTFQLEAVQAGAPLATATLSQPLMLDWGQGAGMPSESAFRLQLAGIRLAEWLPAVTTNSPNGLLFADVNVRSRQAGKEIAYQASVRGTELIALMPGRPAPPAAIQINLAGTVTDFTSVVASNLAVQFSSASMQALSLTGKARFDTKTSAGTLEADVEASLPRLSPWISVEGAEYRDGVTRLKLRAEQTAPGTNGTLPRRSLRLDGTAERIHARYRDIKIEGWSKTAILDAVMEGDIVKVNQLQAQIRTPESKVPATFGVKGKFDVSSGAGSAKTAFSRIHQEFLRPFLQGTAFGSNLLTAELEGEGNADFNPKGVSTYTGRIGVTNLWVKSPAPGNTNKALAMALSFDASSAGPVHEIKSIKLDLGGTAKAPRNEIEAQGKFDLKEPEKMRADLKVTGDSVDLTAWHSAWSAGPSPVSEPTPAKPTATSPATEPKAVKLPVQLAQWNIRFGKLFLGEIGLSNLVFQGELNAGKLSIKPLSFVINQATNSLGGEIDLGVDGFRYDMALGVPAIPLEPFVNTFAPGYRGQFQGLLTASAAVKGAGTTGVNLKRSLSGHLAASVTNANLHIVSPRAKLILTPIAIALRLNDLLKSPLESMEFESDLGQGQIRLKRVSVLSEMFRAETAGSIPISDDLNQSPLNLPVNFSLTRTAAEKANLLPEGTPETQAFVPLPRFATIKGTLGVPATDINKLVISGMLLKSAAKIPGLAGDKAADVLQGIGNLLTKPATPAVTQPPTSNPQAPAAPAPVQRPQPAAPPQTQAPSPAPSPVQTGLDLIKTLTDGNKKKTPPVPASSGTTPAPAPAPAPAPPTNPPAPPKN